MPTTKIVIIGAKGRMGQTLRACVFHETDFHIAGCIDLGDDLGAVIGACDVVIDFSSHDGTPDLVDCCVKHLRPAVIGTTGHTQAEQERILAAAKLVPIVWTSNFSTGVNALFWLTRRAAEILGPGFDVEIVEMHHRHKKDAPSGTAMNLAKLLAETRQVQLDKVITHGRAGLPGERNLMEIGVHAVRGGDVVGDHTVIFAAPGERVELTHKAGSRETFARGALKAARWLVGRQPGLYTMQHVLGLL